MSRKHQNKNLIIKMTTYCCITRQSSQLYVYAILRVPEVIHTTCNVSYSLTSKWICLVCMPSGFRHTYQANSSCPCYNYYKYGVLAIFSVWNTCTYNNNKLLASNQSISVKNFNLTVICTPDYTYD